MFLDETSIIPKGWKPYRQGTPFVPDPIASLDNTTHFPDAYRASIPDLGE